jgi:hypothetical protein
MNGNRGKKIRIYSMDYKNPKKMKRIFIPMISSAQLVQFTMASSTSNSNSNTSQRSMINKINRNSMLSKSLKYLSLSMKILLISIKVIKIKKIPMHRIIRTSSSYIISNSMTFITRRLPSLIFMRCSTS